MNQKGGVGKTQTVGNLAHAFAGTGQRVLMIDNDPQGNLGRAFLGGSVEQATLADVLDRRHPATLADAVIPTSVDGLAIVQSGGPGLQAVQDGLIGQPGADRSLAVALRDVLDDWDQILIDCRPATDLITRCALMAADQAIIVLQPEQGALDGWAETQNAINQLAVYLDKTLPVRGVIVNMVDLRRKDHAENLDYIRATTEDLGVPVLGDPVPMSADISRLAAVGMGIDQLAAPSARLRNVAANFAMIARSLQEVPA
ncbi:MAG: ParA family protein [Gordonia sp. (in: high G+C Gram-positive bacteria)]|uniref:ParA family protein n=1 Tax=Gordonia sp. (in: high G+C Gram-positive bacteria) TaxID=84139 RepID=UPI003BB79486